MIKTEAQIERARQHFAERVRNQHTPSPWRWWRDEHDSKEGLWWLVVGPEGKESSVMPAVQAHDDFPSRPDARLIATAPDLLEQLEILYGTLVDGEQPTNEQLARAGLALAKAKGV